MYSHNTQYFYICTKFTVIYRHHNVPYIIFVTLANLYLQLKIHCTEHLNDNSKKSLNYQTKTIYSHIYYIVI